MTYYNITSTTASDFIRIVRPQLEAVYGSGVGGDMYYIQDRFGLSMDGRSVIDGAASMSVVSNSSRNRVKLVLAFMSAIKRAGGTVWFKHGRTSLTPEIVEPSPFDSEAKLLFSFDERNNWAKITLTAEQMREIYGEPIEGESPSVEGRTDIVVTPLSGWAEGYVSITPSEELLSGVPAGVRALATRHALAARSADSKPYLTEGGALAWGGASTDGDYPPGATIIAEARTAYREMVRARLGRPFAVDNEAFERKREEHRQKTKQNFEAFVRNRPKDTEHHIGKLPFVPHGLASSRRWGIEVESGGARGVETPRDWSAKGDGSLRSAYAGYVEVQDFEPYDEEVTERVMWQYCTNAENHNPYVRATDAIHGEVLEPNPNFIHPRDCQQCGDVTRIVHRVPETIHHVEKPGDCREFVSPILTSMHSQGLQQLTEALSKNPQNSSAGVHVHVESNDLTPQQIATLVYGYDILEPILEASYRRERRDFCERRDAEQVLEAARKVKGEGLRGNEGRRYSTLNTHSLSQHGTLEFRAMGPVYEYEYLIRWAMLCRELVNSVANGAKTRDFAKIKSWDDLTSFLAMFGKEYVRAAVYELTGEVGEAKRLEKAGERVTTEALNLDFNAMTVGISRVAEAATTLFRHVNMFNTVRRADVSQLVGAEAVLAEV